MFFGIKSSVWRFIAEGRCAKAMGAGGFSDRAPETIAQIVREAG